MFGRLSLKRHVAPCTSALLDGCWPFTGFLPLMAGLSSNANPQGGCVLLLEENNTKPGPAWRSTLRKHTRASIVSKPCLLCGCSAEGFGAGCRHECVPAMRSLLLLEWVLYSTSVRFTLQCRQQSAVGFLTQARCLPTDPFWIRPSVHGGVGCL